MRQSRTLARLANSEEREEQLAEATREHEENEQFIAEIRLLLTLAPHPQRSYPDHAQELEARLFPPLGRAAQDDKERTKRFAAVADTIRARGLWLERCLLAIGVVLVVAGAGYAIRFDSLGWIAPPMGAVLLVMAWRLSVKLNVEREAELQRQRDAITTEIAEQFEADNRQHDVEEKTRQDRLKRLLAGDETTCEDVFRTAAEKLELPVDAMPIVELVTPSAAEIHVSLHAPEEIPTQTSRLLKSGRISYRNRAQKLIREDDTRAMSSLCLLAAAVAFDALPSLEVAMVSGFRSGIDRATGKDADLCYITAVVDRSTIAGLRLDRVDSLAAIRALDLHRLAARKTFILKPVRPFNEDQLEDTAFGHWFLAAGPQATGKAGSDTMDQKGAAGKPEESRARESKPPAAETDEPSAFKVASHVLTVAMACARADGEIRPEERRAMDELLKEHLAHLDSAEAAELEALRTRLSQGELAVETAARALGAFLQPGERQMLLEQIVGIAVADETIVAEERGLLEAVAAALDIAPTVLDEALERRKPESGAEAESAESQRRRWLAALELPADALPDRLAIERAASRILDLYSVDKFALLAPELQGLAQERRQLATDSLAGLVAELPPEPAHEPDEAPHAVRRDNPDLDSIFG